MSNPSAYPRDLVGYGRNPPHPAWPGDARIAVQFVLNYEEGSEYWADMTRSEALMYAQPKRIDAAVRALQRPDDLPAAAFFVGFAGQGDQRVFAGEIALARKVFAAKFGSAQRSVLLVNDRRDFETLPLASPTALRYALNGIAARMKLDRDVLFLALSSHGSKNGERTSATSSRVASSRCSRLRAL